MERIALVFVHGLFSSARAWNSFRSLIEADQGIDAVDLFDFEYPSPKVRLSPLKRIPDFDTLADGLQTFLETLRHSRVILVSHSQGGLIVQRYLARAVMNMRGRELVRIRQVAMFACPNSGSQIFLTLRRTAVGWSHPQERRLRPLDDAVHEAQRVVIGRVVYAESVSSEQCPVRVHAYAGEEDNVVTPASARGVFPDTGVLPGDHFSIIRPDSADHRSYRVLRAHIDAVLQEPVTAPVPRPGVVRSGARDYVYVSARKVARIGRTLSPDVWARVRCARSGVSYSYSGEATFEAIAASVESRAEDVIALVPGVEVLLDREHRLKDVGDKDLRIGHWFVLREVPMLYGVPSDDCAGTIFIGETSGVRFALGGSAEYLLDRPAPDLVGYRRGYPPSGLRGTQEMLREAAALDRHGGGGSDDDVELLKKVAGPRNVLNEEYRQTTDRLGSGWLPLTAVARCLHAETAPDGSGTVLGTPLYVAFSVPE